MPGPRERLTIEDVATILDVKAATVRAYRSRAEMPAPDGKTGRTPWWYRKTIETWIDGRKKKP